MSGIAPEPCRVDCPARYLSIGETMTCTLTGTAGIGQYANEAWVTGWGCDREVDDSNWSHDYGYNDYAA